MPTTYARSPWDFSEALEVLQAEPIHLTAFNGVHSPSEKARAPARLGDFTKMWAALGMSVDAKDFATDSDTVKTQDIIPNPNWPLKVPNDEIYASDGGVAPARKNVTWNDEPEVLEVTDAATTPTSEEGAFFDKSLATKKQRKKARKKQRKEEKRLQEQAKARKTTSDVESESEIRGLQRPTPAAKASKHVTILTERVGTAVVEPEQQSSAAAPTATATVISLMPSRALEPKIAQARTPSPAKQRHVRTPSNSKVAVVAQKEPNHSFRTFSASLLPSAVQEAVPSAVMQPVSSVVTQSVPSAVTQASPFAATQALASSPSPDTPLRQIIDSLGGQYGQSHVPNHVPIYITQSFARSPQATEKSSFKIMERSDRNFHLFLRLVHVFPEDSPTLTQHVPLADHNRTPTGIHVMIDFSNIWIGFMDHLKALSFKLKTPIPHQHLSFDALVRVLERGRPTAKRVLAGSAPLIPAIEHADKIGYECLILDKVYKQRLLSEKKRRELALQTRHGHSGALEIQGGGGAGPSPIHHLTPASLPPSAAPLYAPEKWVEQGVDEMLHLQMANSVLDAEEPAVMVVATGDAAKAEYSEGFKEQIVRAMRRGWFVELVAFSKSISYEYRRPEFLAQWDDQFRIIELDEWAQYLLDT